MPRLHPSIAGVCTEHSPRSPTSRGIATERPGIARALRSAPTKTWPPSSKPRRKRSSPTGATRRSAPFSSGPLSPAPTRATVPTARSPQHAPRSPRAPTPWPWRCSTTWRPRTTASAHRPPAFAAQSCSTRRLMDQTPDVLLAAARELVPLDVRLARDAHLEALGSSLFAAPLGRAGAVRQAAEAALALPAASEETTADALLEGLRGRSRKVTLLPLRLFAARSRWHEVATIFARSLVGTLRPTSGTMWGSARRHALGPRGARRRRHGLACARPALPRSHGGSAGRPFPRCGGRIGRARDLFRSVSGRSTPGRADGAFLLVASWRGREAEARRLAEDAMQDALARGPQGRIRVSRAPGAPGGLPGRGRRGRRAGGRRRRCPGSGPGRCPTSSNRRFVPRDNDVAEDAVSRLEEVDPGGRHRLGSRHASACVNHAGRLPE